MCIEDKYGLHLVFCQHLYYVLLEHYKRDVRIGISIYNCLCRTISTIGQKYIATMVYNRGIKFGIHV